MRPIKLQSKSSFISPSGSYIGWHASDQFWVFETTETGAFPKTTGKFTKQGHYYYGPDSLERKQFHQSVKFTCAAMSDEFIAFGARGKLLIFSLLEDSGRLRCIGNLPRDHIMKVIFSPDGTELVVLVTTKDGMKARVYSASNFFRNINDSADKPKEISPDDIEGAWGDFVGDIADAVFSSDGKKIAICTSHDINRESRIRFLQKETGAGWSWVKGTGTALVLETSDDSPGITGMSLYKLCPFSLTI